MFDELRLIDSNERSIVVETRRGSRIKNDIPAPSGAAGTRKYELLRKRFGRQWESRKTACDGYNCFGHVFASRRTAIREDGEVRKILSDDGYRKLRPGETPQIEDLALYLDRNRGELLHCGRVSRVDYLTLGDTGPGRTPVVKILSKWDDTTGEDVHHCQDVPFTAHGFQWQIEFWTDRE